MLTNHLSISIAETVDDAPNYNDKDEFKAIKLDKCVIVKNGTKEGNTTVDIQMTDADGNKFVALVTGKILKAVAQTIDGAEAR